MAIYTKQTVTSSKTVNTGTTSTANLATTGTGNLVVVGTCTDSGVSSITGIACSGMSFAKIDDSLVSGGTYGVSLWYAYNITTAVAPTLTLTYVGGAIGGAIVREYSGISTISPLDQHIIAAGSSTAPSSGASAALTRTNDLVVGFGGTGDSGNTYTAGSGYTAATTLKIGTTVDMGIEDKLLIGIPTAQTANFTITGSSVWACVVATFMSAESSKSGGNYSSPAHLIVDDGLSRSEVAN